MTVTIRPATLDDVSLLSQLAPQIYREHFGHTWNSVSELNAYLESEYSESALKSALEDAGLCWFVACTDSLIGFAKLTWESTIPDSSLSGALLNKLYLNQQVTGKQYGKVLFDHIVQQVKKRGQSFFWLEVLEHNPRARKFYENQGMHYIKDSVFKTELQQTRLHIMGMPV